MKRIMRKSHLFLTFGILFVLCFSISVSAKSHTKLIGHRGFSGKYMENTVKSMRKAYKSGFDGVEMDLWESTDHTLWVCHDGDLKDLTGKDKMIYNLKFSDRFDYKLKNGRLIPDLNRMLRMIQGKNYIFIHIKGNGKGTLSLKAQHEIVSTIKKYHLQKNVYIFGPESIMDKLNFGSIKTGWSTDAKNASRLRKMVRRAKAKNVDFLMLLHLRQYKVKGNGAKFVAYAHKYGIKTGLYFTKTHSYYRYIKRIKADFALSDYNVK